MRCSVHLELSCDQDVSSLKYWPLSVGEHPSVLLSWS